MSDSIIHRQGRDDYEATVIADAMQSMAGVNVVSIVYANDWWHVYAAFDSSLITIEAIDLIIKNHVLDKE